MKVHCPSCASFVPGGDIDLEQARAVCRRCGELISLTAIVAVGPTQPSPGDTAGALTLARPTDLRCREERQIDAMTNAMVWTFTPRRDGVGALWHLALLALWTTLAVSFLRDAPTLFLSFLPIVPLVGLSWLRGVINWTRASMSREQFCIARGPLPQGKPLKEATSNIDRFEAGTRMVDKGRGGLTPCPTLLLVTRDARSIPITLDLKGDDQARWLAARWNEALADMQAPPVPRTYRG